LKEEEKAFLAVSFLIGFGAISLLFSFLADSIFLLFIGLGLTIWGTSLVFTSSTRLVRANLVIPQINNFMLTLDDFLKNLKAHSESTFVPPKILGENPVQKVIVGNPRSSEVSLIPSGLSLEWLFEKKSKVDFLTADLDYLKEFLSIAFTDDLGLATDFEMSVEKDVIHVNLAGFIMQELCEKVHKVDERICRRTPCPVCSAIACALTKVTRKAVSIEKTSVSDDSLDLWFKISEL